MNFLASLFIAKPLNILVVAAVFLAIYLILRFKVTVFVRSHRSLLITAILWGLYAAWEWLILLKTPEANIRVDLLLIWPALATFSIWALYRALR